MTSPLLNQPAPDFDCEAHNGQQVRLADYRGKSMVVLFYYPMDGTPVCTKEACGFRDAFKVFAKLGAVVIGVSADSPDRHRNFAESQSLPFLLLSDHDGSLRKAYRVPKTLGILPSRVTFVIDKAGIVRHVFSALFSANRHVTEALEIVHTLSQEDLEISRAARKEDKGRFLGMTVKERLAEAGLNDRWEEAVRARDAKKMVEILDILQGTEIIMSYGPELAAVILSDPSQPPIHLNLDDPRNSGVHRRKNERKFPPCIRPVECPIDPYWHLGSDPDSVMQVWDKLGSALPFDCRCIVYGRPGLVAPRSGILIATAFAMDYGLRIPREAMDDAVRSGAKTKHTGKFGPDYDLAKEFGDDWIFGTWFDHKQEQEHQWLLDAYRAIEGEGYS